VLDRHGAAALLAEHAQSGTLSRTHAVVAKRRTVWRR
jgi:hypothetical protein